MARVIHTLVSISGYLAVRHSFGISGLLRSRGLSRVFVFSPLLWPLCSRGPAMRRCIDVDLRHCCLLNRRGSLHRAFALAPSIAPTIGRVRAIGSARDSAIRLATDCRAARGSARGGDGGGLKCHTSPHSPRVLPPACESAILGDPGCCPTTGHLRSLK